jgi:hypothetical protein
LTDFVAELWSSAPNLKEMLFLREDMSLEQQVANISRADLEHDQWKRMFTRESSTSRFCCYDDPFFRALFYRSVECLYDLVWEEGSDAENV